jgi:hypothetical protein
MCASLAHFPLFPASKPRTWAGFLPTFSSDGRKLHDVRAHLPGFPAISRTHGRVSCHFWPSDSRTSPEFLPREPNRGRKQAYVRESTAEKRHMCANAEQKPHLLTASLARNGLMCANHAHTRVSDYPGDEIRAHAREPNPRAHAQPAIARRRTRKLSKKRQRPRRWDAGAAGTLEAYYPGEGYFLSPPSPSSEPSSEPEALSAASSRFTTWVSRSSSESRLSLMTPSVGVEFESDGAPMSSSS